MNNFTKEELESLISMMGTVRVYTEIEDYEEHLYIKIQSMIDALQEENSLLTIGTGQLLFHSKESSSGIIPKIGKQLELCENSDETKCFRIDWRILYGKKYGQ